MIKMRFFLIFVSVIMLASCGSPSENNINPTAEIQLVPCPLCGGTGGFCLNQGDFMTSQTCGACEGRGKCDAEMAEQIIDFQNYLSSYLVKDNYLQYGNGRSAAEIQYDIDRAYDLLHNMEEGYNNCSSGVLSTQYPGMISDQKDFIRQMENELRNSQ